jgi:hypothetical protein
MNEPVDTEKAKAKHSAYSKQHSTPLITTIASRNQKTPSTNKRGAKSRLAELCETSPSLSKLNKSNMKQTKLDAFVKKKDSAETPIKLEEANTKETFFDTENDRPSPISSKYDSARSSRSSSPISFTAPLSPKKRNSVEDEDDDEDEEDDSNKPKLDCLSISALNNHNNNTITNKNDHVSFVQPKTPPAQPSQARDESFNVSISSTKAEISQTSIVDDLNETISAYNDNEETVKENNERQARLIEAELIINGSGTPTKTLTKRKSKKDELLKLSREKTTELREEYDSSSSLVSARSEEQQIVKPVNAAMSMPLEQVNIKQVSSQCPRAETKPTANFEAPPAVQPTAALAPPQTAYNSMEQANLMTPCAYPAPPPVQTAQQPMTAYNSYYPDQNGLQMQQQSAYHPNQPVYYANQQADPQYYPYMQQQQQPTSYQQMQPGYYPNNQNYMYPAQMPNQQMYQAGYPQQQQPPAYYNYSYYNMPHQYKQPDVTQTPPPPTRPLSQPGSMPLPAEKQLPQQSQYASLTPLQPMSQMPAQPYYQQTPAQYNQMQPGAQASQQYPINPNYYGSTGYYYPPQTSQ